MMKSIKTMLLLLVPLLLVYVAYATTPTPASGGFELMNTTPTSSKYADGNTINTSINIYKITGTFNGTFVEDVRQVIKSTGKGTFQGLGTFYGTVDGASGTALVRVVAKINGSTAQGQFVILSGTDGLENLHGQGTIDQVGTTGTYSAQIHFDPN